MRKADILMLCPRQYAPQMEEVVGQLKKLGVRTKLFENSLVPEELSANQLLSLISHGKVILFFLSSEYGVEQEMKDAYRLAKSRDKKIVCLNGSGGSIRGHLEFWEPFSDEQQIEISMDDLNSEQGRIDVAKKIHALFSDHEEKELLYEKITNLSGLTTSPELASALTDQIALLCREVVSYQSNLSRRGIYMEILQCAGLLLRWAWFVTDMPDMGDRELAHRQLEIVGSLDRLLDSDDFRKMDLFLLSFALKINYTQYHIHNGAINVLSHGAHNFLSVIGKGAYKEYLERQSFYLAVYDRLIAEERITDASPGKYPEEELSYILRAKEYLLSERVSGNTRPASSVEKAAVQSDTKIEKELLEVVELIQQSNKLFELVGGNPFTADFLKCLKTSYERLRKYSEIVNCQNICAQCISRIAEINQSLDQCCETDSDPDVAESGLKALLGFSLPGTDHFDVFLSYKHEDRDIVRSVYHFLKRNLLHPFLDLVTLPELAKSEYEDAIMKAIDNSKHFVVVLTDLKQLDAPWIQLEMKTFRHEIVEGRKEDANFILLVSDEVDQEIKASNKTCLPIEYRGYEIMRIDSYQKTILSYLK